MHRVRGPPGNGGKMPSMGGPRKEPYEHEIPLMPGNGE